MPELAPLLTPNRRELPELIREFHRQASPWLPAGLGNHLHWGPPVQQPSPALSCAALNRIIEHAVGDFTVTVEAGLPLAELQAALAEKNQWLAIDPPLAGPSSIGGLVARGLSGRLRHRHLNLRDQIIGISLIRADGTGAKAGGRVVKNVAGYDLMRLFCGSWGSLGLITELSLRTQPIPPLRQLLRAEGSAVGLQQLRQQLLLHSPLALELLEWRQGPGSESTQGPAQNQGQPWLEIGLVSLDAAALADQKEKLLALASSVQAVQISETGQNTYPATTYPATTYPASTYPASTEPVAINHWLLRLGVEPLRSQELLGRPEARGWQLRLGAASGLGLAEAPFKVQPAYRVEALRQACQELGGSLTVLQAPPGSAIPAWGDAPARSLIEAIKRQFDPLQQLARGRLPGVAPRQAGPPRQAVGP